MRTTLHDAIWAALALGLDGRRAWADASSDRGVLTARATGYFRRRHPDAAPTDIDWATAMVRSVALGTEAGDDTVTVEFARYLGDVADHVVGGTPSAADWPSRALARPPDPRIVGHVVLRLIDGLAFS